MGRILASTNVFVYIVLVTCALVNAQKTECVKRDLMRMLAVNFNNEDIYSGIVRGVGVHNFIEAHYCLCPPCYNIKEMARCSDQDKEKIALAIFDNSNKCVKYFLSEDIITSNGHDRRYFWENETNQAMDIIMGLYNEELIIVRLQTNETNRTQITTQSYTNFMTGEVLNSIVFERETTASNFYKVSSKNFMNFRVDDGWSMFVWVASVIIYFYATWCCNHLNVLFDRRPFDYYMIFC